MIDQYPVRIQSDRAFPFAQKHAAAPRRAPALLPIRQPAHADVTAKPTAEEDGVEVAERFDDEIGTPGAVARGGYGVRKTLNGLPFRTAGFPAHVVMAEYVQACLPSTYEWAVVGLGEPFLSRCEVACRVVFRIFVSR